MILRNVSEDNYFSLQNWFEHFFRFVPVYTDFEMLSFVLSQRQFLTDRYHFSQVLVVYYFSSFHTER